VLHDEDLAHAIVDRILERGRMLTLDGPSMRTKHLGLDDPTSPEASHQPARISGIEAPEFPEPTLVSARSATSRRVQFLNDSSYDLVPGSYRLEFRAYAEDPQQSACSLSATFNISPAETERWRNTMGQAGAGISQGSIAIFWS
jgi:hypothetical protein